MKKLTKIVCGLLLATIAGSSFASANQEFAKNSIYSKIGISAIDFKDKGTTVGLGGAEFKFGYERRIPLNNSVDYKSDSYFTTKRENHYFIGFRGELGFANYNSGTIVSTELGIVQDDIKLDIKGSSASLLVGFGSQINLHSKSDIDYTQVANSKLEYGLYLGVKHTKLNEKAYTNTNEAFTTLVFQPELSVIIGNHFKIGTNIEISGKSGVLDIVLGGTVGVNY